MAIVLIVGVLAALAAKLRLPIFETVMGVLLLAPIAAFPVSRLVPLGAAVYGVIILLLLALLSFARRSRAGEPSSEPPAEQFESVGVFVVFFLLNYSFCLLWPDFIAMGERLRDYALLNSVLNGPGDAHEPWMSGATLNYYLYWYRFGHVLASLGRLEPWQVYHQLQSFTVALGLASIFHLARRSLRLDAPLALAVSSIIIYGSNIAGVSAFLRHDTNWWGPSRVIPGAINEFPAWSFLLGDLHPHFLNLPLTPFLLVIGTAIAAGTGPLRTAGAAALAVVSPVWFYNANAWDVPFSAAVIGGAIGIFAIAARQPGAAVRGARGIVQSRAALAVLVGALAAALSLVFSSRNILPGDTPLRLVGGAVARSDMGSFLSHWGLPLGVVAVMLILLRPSGREKIMALLAIGAAAFSPDALPLLVLLAGLAIWRVLDRIIAARRGCAPYGGVAGIFDALTVVSLLFLIFPEIAFLDDPYGGENERMNTIFKVYAAIWVPLHLAALYLLSEAGRAGVLARLPQAARPIAAGICTVLLLGFFVRTIEVRRSKAWSVQPYARGLTEIDRLFPGSAETITALDRLPPGVVLEAQGPAYDYTTHIATLSGNTAFLGWANHVNLLTRDYGEVSRREQLTREFYTTMPCAEKRAMLEREKIAYVVLGPLERRAYPGLRSEEFGCLTLAAGKGSYAVFAAAAVNASGSPGTTAP